MSELSRGAFSHVSAAASNVHLRIRCYGGGVYELATPDDKTIVLIDAWIWDYAGFTAFGIPKPAEFASASAYAAHMKSRNPEAMIVALTHDHADHMGDYFDLLGALTAAGIDVKTVGQSDLMRVGLPPKFKAANLEPAKLVLNNGAGINMGGSAHYKGVRIWLVPAVHSTAAGFPAAGFIIDIGGTRVYASGDTDLYGDLALIGRRYQPAVAILSTGNGAFTMGPEDAATAVQVLGVPHAIPVHFAHNPLVLGTQCADLFRAAVGRAAPHATVTVLTPGEPTMLTLPAVTETERAAPPTA
jgi:L-ascorbate metabolism protein UlaG (beta-lactamase superfamily)